MQWYAYISRHFVFVSIFLVVATLRLWPLFDYQFTYDEIATLQRVGYTNFSDLVNLGVKIDAHPILVQLFVYLIARFTEATWVIKLPFILMSLGAVTYGYAFGVRNFSRISGLAATLILGFSLPFVYQAPIARMYSGGIFFSLAMLFHFAEITWRQRASTKHYVLFALFMLLGALNHHINALFALTLFGAGLMWVQPSKLKPYLIAGACAVLCYLPHLPVTIYQLGIGGIGYEQGGWLAPPNENTFTELLNVLFGTGGALVVMITLLLTVVMWGYRTERIKKQLFLAGLFVLNFLVVYLYSIYRATIYQHTVMLFAGTALVMAFAAAIDCKRENLNRVLLLLMGIWLAHQTYFHKQYFQQGVKSGFEFQFSESSRLMKEKRPEKVAPLFLEADSVMRLLYCNKYGIDDQLLARNQKLFSGDSGLKEFAHLIPDLKADHVVLSSSMPIHQALVKEFYPYLSERIQTQAIHYKVYSKKPFNLPVNDDRVLLEASNSAPGPFSGGSLIPTEGLVCSPENEFPYGWQTNYDSLGLDEGFVLLAEWLIESDEENFKLENCIMVIDSAGNVKQYSAAAASVFMRVGKKKTLRTQLYIGNFHINRREGYLLKIYLWNRGAERFILRRLSVKLVDHWHEKWHFWD